MGWTTIRVREETKQELDDRIEGRNMDDKLQKLLGNIETYIDERVRKEIDKLEINQRTGELEMR